MTNAYEEGKENVVAKRRIRNYLINPRFQLAWVLRVVFLVTIIVSVMGYFLYETVSDASDQLVAGIIGDTTFTPEVQKAMIMENEADKFKTKVRLISALVGLVVLLGVVTIILTHKIAGPVYKLRRLFSDIDGNHLQLHGKLRKGDELQEVFLAFDEMLRRLREFRHRDLDELQTIRDMLVARGDTEDLCKRIDELVVRYSDSVKML